MRIEDEIKQLKFKNEHHKMMINLLFTGKWVQQKITQHFKTYDITPEQYNVLRILRGQYPGVISINGICERMIDKMSNVSRLVDKLQKKELVDRRMNLEDRRQMDITITEKGLKLLDELDKVEEESLAWTEHFSDKEAESLNYLLDHLRN